MAINFCNDRITLGSYTIAANTGGAAVAGVICAKGFCGVVFSPVQGQISGYTAGGTRGGLPTPVTNVIDKFPFSSDSSATDVGDLSACREGASGQSSPTDGYTSGGNGHPNTSVQQTIDKFPFSSDTDATNVANLAQSARTGTVGNSSLENGYSSGGYTSPGSRNAHIHKFPFSSDTNATYIANLSCNSSGASGQSSPTHGYVSGGDCLLSPYVCLNVIQKLQFAIDDNASDVGDLTRNVSFTSGASSKTNGYVSGGQSPNGISTIERFPFATDANSFDVAEMNSGRKCTQGGQSSRTHGYVSGGFNPDDSDTIDKFNFAAEVDTADVGELTQVRFHVSGQQV